MNALPFIQLNICRPDVAMISHVEGCVVIEKMRFVRHSGRAKVRDEQAKAA